MPNGRPGDHPYTDIVVHGSSSEFGEEISALVRQMARTPGFLNVREEVVGLLESVSFHPRPENWSEVMAQLLHRLLDIDASMTAQQ